MKEMEHRNKNVLPNMMINPFAAALTCASKDDDCYSSPCYLNYVSRIVASHMGHKFD